MAKIILILILIIGFYVFTNLDNSHQDAIISTAATIPVKLGNVLEQTAHKVDDVGYQYGIGK